MKIRKMQPYLKFLNGDKIPSIAFGTGTTYKGQVEPVIKGNKLSYKIIVSVHSTAIFK